MSDQSDPTAAPAPEAGAVVSPERGLSPSEVQLLVAAQLVAERERWEREHVGSAPPPEAIAAPNPDVPSSYLSLDAVRHAEDRVYRDVEVPEWGGRVRIQSLTLGDARDIQREAIVAHEIDMTRVLVGTLQRGLVHPRLMDDSQARTMLQKHARVVTSLVIQINEITGVTPESVEAMVAAFRQ